MRAALGLVLLLAAHPAHAQTFRRPVACDGCIANWYYFDQNGADPGRQDWSCGTSSYDGHRGSDFSLAGGNGAIDAGHDVVAAADGVVESTQDGHYDRCGTCDATVDSRCGTGFGFGYGNHVVINHGTYKVVYAHMRTGSVRVAPGATVRCGDPVGQIGSSGCTTGAHLHFEVRPSGGTSASAFDPFAGACSPTSPSRWTEQGPHRGMPSPACDGAPSCPAGTYPIWTCDAAGTERRRCIDGVDMIEGCPFGCTSMPVGTDDVCAPPPDTDGDGYAAGADCDDGDASRHPGAFEICGDGVDQDCDGGDLPCAPIDGGLPAQDGGSSRDAGTRDDAGRADSAAPPLDASTPALDGGARRSGRLTGGCGCRVTPASSRSPLALFAILLALALRRIA